jgi:hypothetical protein
VWPIPDGEPVKLTTYDAKDPDTNYPPIVPLRPPTGAPNVGRAHAMDTPYQWAKQVVSHWGGSRSSSGPTTTTT